MTFQLGLSYISAAFTILAAILGIIAIWVPDFRRRLGETAFKLFGTSLILGVCAVILAILVK